MVSSDIHKNPGPMVDPNKKYNCGFLSFGNWNLNTLSKDVFHRISLPEANNTLFNYDFISLCETSLNDSLKVAENILNGYIYHGCNHPSGKKQGGVGIFYKSSLSLKIRNGLSFDECIVTELRFGRKNIFFTVLYRNPADIANLPEFEKFTSNFEILVKNIRLENPSGDFNGHSESWWSGGDSNKEGLELENTFFDRDLTQHITEPTNFRKNCNPSCIDLFLTDQPTLITNSGVRPSLDPTCEHQMIFCKLNFKPPFLPPSKRHIWQFGKAERELIERAVRDFPWQLELCRNCNPNAQVDVLNKTIMNIMSNFVPNKMVTSKPNVPQWISRHIINMMRRQNKLYKKYKKNGFNIDDKERVDKFREECLMVINIILTKLFKLFWY